MMTNDSIVSCPIPLNDYPQVLLAHGGGGRLMDQLIAKMFAPAFANPLLAQRHDGALINLNGRGLAFTTDSYVVHPLFFPGGDIGKLAINGTVNDLAMCGARPLYLSASFIIEEGLSMQTLWRVVQSMKRAAADAGIQVVTGDTKVVDKGKGDGLFINTAGIGRMDYECAINPAAVLPGDAVLLSGDIGRHGMAIMSVREGLQFESSIESDCVPLADLVQSLLKEGIAIHCLRDLTRGGLASALNEIAQCAGKQIDIDQNAVPVREEVQGACEILGLDPLYVANEGRFVAFVPASDADRAIRTMRSGVLGAEATQIGVVTAGSPGLVTLKTQIGARRILDLLSGEQLPRIC
jgi:hydrogenase expression/formation protein HypE